MKSHQSKALGTAANLPRLSIERRFLEPGRAASVSQTVHTDKGGARAEFLGHSFARILPVPPAPAGVGSRHLAQDHRRPKGLSVRGVTAMQLQAAGGASHAEVLQRFEDPPGVKVNINALTDATLIQKYIDDPDAYNITPQELAQLKARLEVQKQDLGLAELGISREMVEQPLNLFNRIQEQRPAIVLGKKTRKRKQADPLSKLARLGSVTLQGVDPSSPTRVGSKRAAEQEIGAAFKRTRKLAETLTKEESDVHPGTVAAKGTEILKADSTKYRWEGFVTTYDQKVEIGAPNEFEFDHQPQNDLIEKAAKMSVSTGKPIKDVAKDHSKGGRTIVLAHIRHAAGATYGKASPYAPRLDAIESSSEQDNTKISKVKAVLKEATNADADEILGVYKDKAKSYKDVDSLKGHSAAEKATLKDNIQKKVQAGEAILKAQTFDEWFS